MSKPTQRVIVEGKEFASITAAAKYLQSNTGALQYCLQNNRDRKFNGLSIAYADKDKEAKIQAYLNSKPTRTTSRIVCPVICETLNKRFSTINAAARFAGVNNWTMSVKMETAGQFVDKKGNVYKRLKPMQTKNCYANTGDTIMIEKPHHTKEVEQSKATISGIELARNILKDKVASYIQSDDFKIAKELLEVIELIKE